MAFFIRILKGRVFYSTHKTRSCLMQKKKKTMRTKKNLGHELHKNLLYTKS
jgi:hypothetical protein